MNHNNFISKSYKYLLPLGFITIILMMIATSFFARLQVEESNQLMIKNVKQHHLNSKLLRTMSLANSSRAIVLLQISKLEDPFLIDELFLTLDSLSTDFVVAREKFAKQNLNPELKKLFIQQGKITRRYLILENKVQELLQKEDYKKSSALFANEILPGKKIVTKSIEKMSNYEFELSKNAFKQLKNNSDKVSTTIFALDLLAIFISILLAIYVLKKKQTSDKELVSLANTDVLTDLPNRSNFIYNVDKEIRTHPTSTFAIIYIDIDNFKTINDNYGHEFGDQILRNFSSKLSSSIENADVLSRFGGDEFVLMLCSIKSEAEAVAFVRELSKNLDATCIVDNREIYITSSIGVSIYSNDQTDAKTLLKHADIAMYCAKEAGKNGFRFFSEHAKKKMDEEHAITYALQTLVRNQNKDNELFLKYQPLLNISDGNITECEALLRWKTKDGIEIPTEKFISIAEKSNLIDNINLIVINEACRQQKEWQLNGNCNTRINVNLSGNRASFDRLIKQFRKNMEMLEISPSLFGIEITERTIIDISDETIKELNRYRSEGIKISIDDFGTGYSSLSYLKKLPITTIKIDKSFVTNLPKDQDDCELVKTIITLGHSLKLDVVAEGVETAEQLEFLQDCSCDIAQGYYLHYPLKHTEISKLQLVV